MKKILLRANIAFFFIVSVGAHSLMLCKEDKEGSLYLRKYIASKCLERYQPSCDSADRFMQAHEKNTNNDIICCLAGCGIPLCMILLFLTVVVKINIPSIA